MHRPEIIRELEGLIAYLEEFAPSTKKYGDSLLDAAYRYYGSGAHLLAKDEQNDLLKEMRTSISLIAVQKSQYARSDD
ncbi:hypothetical protein CJO69_11125 [Burkholderia ubonensis]|nr:hypothetical protein CJO69_11125 [Burkholderia ubonensis]RQP69494.1 hypothetical protein DF013_26135 [Burkholderia ubonensis]RQR54896.1 hypothetical protein DIE19_24845 [Burkholderia sp. Bp9126]